MKIIVLLVATTLFSCCTHPNVYKTESDLEKEVKSKWVYPFIEIVSVSQSYNRDSIKVFYKKAKSDSLMSEIFQIDKFNKSYKITFIEPVEKALYTISVNLFNASNN